MRKTTQQKIREPVVVNVPRPNERRAETLLVLAKAMAAIVEALQEPPIRVEVRDCSFHGLHGQGTGLSISGLDA